RLASRRRRSASAATWCRAADPEVPGGDLAEVDCRPRRSALPGRSEDATIVEQCRPYRTGDDTLMTLARPSADFEPRLVLLLCGDPNDAVTRALVDGRSQLGWPLLAVSTQQLLDGVALEDTWTVAGRRVEPQQTAVINRLPLADRLESGHVTAADTMARQALWSR